MPDPIKRVRPSKLFWLRAKDGREPGSERITRLLPTVDELPGDGWQCTGQRTFRSGAGSNSPRSRRARETGKLSASRNFQQAATGRWLWAQVMPLANEADALELVSTGDFTFLVPDGRERILTGERTLEGFVIPGCEASWAHEMTVDVKTVKHSNQVISGAIGATVIVVFGTCAEGESIWADLIAVAQVMGARIREGDI